MNPDAFFEQISKHYTSNLPFVVYGKPNESTVRAMLQNDDALHIALDFSKSGFVCAPFDDSQNVILIPAENSILIESEFVMSNTSETTDNIDSFLEGEKEQHMSLVQKGIDKIKEGELVKVVLSRKETVQLSDQNPIKIVKRLLTNYTSAFVYCWYHPNIGLWLGATPETLLKVEGNRFNTMSLAGTQQYKGALDVAWQKKETEEQQIVTDSIINSIKTTANNVHVSNTETIKAGNLLHLKTVISGTLSEQPSSFQELLKTLHPTPAICGFPKEIAKNFILENENYNREFYTGFLGELNIKQKIGRNTNRRNVENNAYSAVKNTSDLYVNLRCMKLENNTAELFIGGGITKDSIPEKEWEETVNKTKTMKRAIVF